MSSAAPESSVPRHPVRLVSRRTGLSPHVLRVWERRYGVVRPVRSPGGQRLYSDADIERLRLLHRATQSGRNIGQLVALSNDSLEQLVQDDAIAEPAWASETSRAVPSIEAAALLERALAAVPRLDAAALEDALHRALLGLGVAAALDHVIVPLLEEIGRSWERGELAPAHEHLSSAVVRRVLDSVVHQFTPSPRAPVLVVATPSGEAHELGALLASATAAAEGWRVIYLGIDLPAEDVARAAIETRARAVGLSIVHPQDEARLGREIHRLASALPADCQLLLGGAGARPFFDRVQKGRATQVADLAGLRVLLDRLRHPAKSSS